MSANIENAFMGNDPGMLDAVPLDIQRVLHMGTSTTLDWLLAHRAPIRSGSVSGLSVRDNSANVHCPWKT